MRTRPTSSAEAAVIRRTPEATITICLLLGVGAFQLAIALGAPWGRLAWGGAYPDALPTRLRVASAVSTLLYLGIAGLVATGPRTPARRWALRIFSVLMGVEVVVNIASPSWPERLTWGPVAAALAVLLWRRSAIAVT